MPSPEALYNAVKTGSVQLTDLNDDGKSALKSYMDNLPSQSTPSAGIQRYGIDVLHPENSPMMKQVNQDNAQQPAGPPAPPQSFASQAQSLNADDANGNRRTDYPGGFLNPVNDLNRLYNAPLLRELTHGAGQAMGLQDSQMSANKSTGSGLVDSVANIIGQGLGYMTNPSQLENSVGQNFFGNQALQGLGGRVGSFVESKLPQNALGRMAGNAAEQGTIGALGSAAYAPFNTLMTGQDVQDIPKNMLEQGAMGAALGGGLGALGSAAKSGLSSLRGILGGVKEAPLPDYSNVRLSNNDVPANPLSDTRISQMPETSMPNPESFKVGDYAIPTTADGAHLSEPKIIEDIQSKDGVKYYKFEGSNTYMPENMVSKVDDSVNSQGKPINSDVSLNGFTPSDVKTPPPGDKALNIDAKQPEPIKLTDKQVAKNARADNFAREETNPILPDTSSQIQSKTIKDKTSLGQKLDQAYINTVDNVYSLSKFDKSAKAANGGTLNPSDSAYKLALNSRNADMQARQILEHNMIDSQGNITGDSLKSIAKQIPAKDLKAFEDYQVAKHAPTRMARGEKVYKDDLNMTIQKAKMIADNYEKSNPEFKTVNDQYHNFDNQLGQNWLVDTGMIKQDQWNGYKEANPDYTPNNRIFSDLEKNSKFGSKGGFTDQSQPIKTADGSQRPIVSPLESRIEHVATYVKTAKQNEVGQAIVRSLQKNPESLQGWAEIVHDQPHVNVDEMLQKDGPEGLMNHIAQTIENAKQNPDLTKGNIVNVLVNGDVVHLRIHDPQFLEAVGNLSPQAQPKWIEAVGKVTHVMKTTTTGVNPIFGLTKNIWKDIPHAYIASKSTNNPVTFGKDLIGALIDVIGHREAYNSYKNIGGGHSSSLSADRNLLAQSKEKLVTSTGLGQTLKRTLITKPYHMLENFNNAIETAPRLAEYNRIVKQGGGTYDAKVEGLHQANDLTTNFNKRGNYVKQLDSLVPYLNASVQGLDQLARMFKTNPVAASVKATMAISVPTAILYAVNHNDPNYQQMSNYMKDNNFLIPNGDGTFTKIPKPREMGMIFGSLIERAMRSWNDQDPKAFQDFGSNLVQNFAPPGVGGAVGGVQKNGILNAPLGAIRDTIAGPFVNLGLNQDFAYRPIVPKDLAALSPKLQFDPKTSDPAKWLGSKLGESPKQLDYLAKSYLGGIAQLGIPATTGINTSGGILGTAKGVLGNMGDALKQQVTADPLYSNDIQSNFYNEKTKQDQAKKDSVATGIPAQRDLSGYYDKLASSMTPLRKAEKQIQNDNSLSNSEKQAKLRAIQTSMNKMLKAGTIK